MLLTSTTSRDALSFPLSSVADRRQWQAWLGNMAILRHLGVELCLKDEHMVRLMLRQRMAAHSGGLGTEALNGAIIAGMMDCAMSIAGILHFRGRTCGTVQLSIQFMKPVRSSHPTVECYAIRKAPSLVFLEAHLLEEDGRCSALATGIVGVARLSKRHSGDDGRSNWLAPLGMDDQPSRTDNGHPVASDDCKQQSFEGDDSLQFISSND